MARLQQLLEKKRFSMIISLPANDAALAQAALEEGADGLKVHVNVGHRASDTQFGPLSQYEQVFRHIRELCKGPLGVVPAGSPEDVEREEIAKLGSLDFDFYSIYAHHLPSFMLQEEGWDRTFAINDSYDLSMIADLQDFGFTALEASIVPGAEYGSLLTMADLLKYRYLARRAGIPVVVPSQRKLIADDLQPLQEAGVRAVLLGAIVTGRSEQQLRRTVSEFRNAIDRLG